MNVLAVKYSHSPMHTGHHFHDCHQLIYIVKGDVRVHINGEECNASGGTLLLLSRFDRHAIHVQSSEYERYTLRISVDSAPKPSEESELASVLVNHGEGFRHVIDLSTYRSDFEPLLKQMSEEYEQQPPRHEQMLRLSFQAFLIRLLRVAPYLLPDEHSRNALVIDRVRHYLESSYGENISLGALSDEYHLSPSHLSHLFKRITGYAPMEYLQECRMSAAKRQLGSTDLPIKEIVFRCGFSDESNFSRAFKRNTGIPPSEFRKRQKRT